MSALCELADLIQHGSLGADDPAEKDAPVRHGLCVVYSNGQVHAYRNRCPHTSAPMDWQPGKFLSLDKRHIQCSLHGALFRPEDGYCLRGPCQGQSLEAVAVELRDSKVYLSN